MDCEQVYGYDGFYRLSATVDEKQGVFRLNMNKDRFEDDFHSFLRELKIKEKETCCPPEEELKKKAEEMDESMRAHVASCGECYRKFAGWALGENAGTQRKLEGRLKTADELSAMVWKDETDEREIARTAFEIQNRGRKVVEELASNRRKLFKLPGLNDVEATPDIQRILDFLQEGNYSGAYHASRILFDEYSPQSDITALHAFTSIAAGRNQAAFSLIRSMVKHSRPDSAARATAILFEALVNLSEGQFDSSFFLLNRVIEISRRLMQKEILKTAGELLDDIEAKRFATPGFKLNPDFIKMSVYPAIQEKRKPLPERIVDTLESFLCLPGELVRAGSLVRSAELNRTGAATRKKLEFSIVDLTDIQTVYDNIRVKKSEDTVYSFFDLPAEYRTRRVFLAVMHDYEIRKKYPGINDENEEEILLNYFKSGDFTDMNIDLIYVQTSTLRKYEQETEGRVEIKSAFELDIPVNVQDEIRKRYNLSVLVIV